MSARLLKPVFLIFAIVTFIFGASLLAAPGRFLDLFAWTPVDPLLSRLLGAALLAMAWGSLRGFRTGEPAQAKVLIETNAVFCALGGLGFLRHLVEAVQYAPVIWFIFGLLWIFALIWILLWVKNR